MLIYGIAIVFFVLSVVFLMGKGSWLIAGYNTASEQKRRQYDEKKLCRVMGILTLGIGAILCMMQAVNTERFAIICSVILILWVIMFLIYANVGCKRK
jgi:cell division protein FtsW (lipid II flippase)